MAGYGRRPTAAASSSFIVESPQAKVQRSYRPRHACERKPLGGHRESSQTSCHRFAASPAATCQGAAHRPERFHDEEPSRSHVRCAFPAAAARFRDLTDRIRQRTAVWGTADQLPERNVVRSDITQKAGNPRGRRPIRRGDDDGAHHTSAVTPTSCATETRRVRPADPIPRQQRRTRGRLPGLRSDPSDRIVRAVKTGDIVGFPKIGTSVASASRC